MEKRAPTFLASLLFLASLPLSTPLSSARNEDLPNAMMYLMKYGYMDGPGHGSKSAPLLSQDGLREYIREFQAFGGLSPTGQLDGPTVELMKRPRCGVKDIIGKASGSRRKRFALQGSRWKVRALTYRISKYPTTQRLSKPEVDKEIQKALNVWADVTDLTFEQRSFGKVHIDIKFENSMHGDGDPFDGKGGTLAHAFFPVYGGDAHFDDSESWTINSFKGTNLLQTAAHEFGHSLGLSHSDQFKALMAPFYRGYERKVSLDGDDIEAIQSLYGKGDGKKKTHKATTKKPESTARVGRKDSGSDLCSNSTIDSMLSTLDGSTYVFRGDMFWKLTDDAIAPGYPKHIDESWPGLPPNIDASFTWTNGKSYFFKGQQYWRQSKGTMDKGYPKLIANGFEGVPDNMDAAFVWSGNGKIYFFKGSQYWKFDPDQRPPVKDSYPRPTSNWEGVPDNIDGAVQYTNGFTYFFKQGLYYRFDDKKFQVSDGDPAFPRPVGYWWFGCSSEPLKQKASG